MEKIVREHLFEITLSGNHIERMGVGYNAQRLRNVRDLIASYSERSMIAVIENSEIILKNADESLNPWIIEQLIIKELISSEEAIRSIKSNINTASTLEEYVISTYVQNEWITKEEARDIAMNRIDTFSHNDKISLAEKGIIEKDITPELLLEFGLIDRDINMVMKSLDRSPKKEEKSENFIKIGNFIIDNKQEIKSNNPSKKFVMTMLKKSSQFGFPDFVKWSLKNGADLDAKDSRNCTPLYYAAKNYNTFNFNIVKFLVENGADVNSSNFAGATPLIATVPASPMAGPSWHEIAFYLIDNGADMNLQNNKKESFFDYVISKPTFLMKLLDRLKTTKTLSDKNFAAIIEDGTFKVIAKLLEYGADKNKILTIANNAYNKIKSNTAGKDEWYFEDLIKKADNRLKKIKEIVDKS
jgi:hypothetical protein